MPVKSNDKKLAFRVTDKDKVTEMVPADTRTVSYADVIERNSGLSAPIEVGNKLKKPGSR